MPSTSHSDRLINIIKTLNLLQTRKSSRQYKKEGLIRVLDGKKLTLGKVFERYSFTNDYSVRDDSNFSKLFHDFLLVDLVLIRILVTLIRLRSATLTNRDKLSINTFHSHFDEMDASTESDPIYLVAYNIIRAAYINILICYTKEKTNCNRGIKQG